MWEGLVYEKDYYFIGGRSVFILSAGSFVLESSTELVIADYLTKLSEIMIRRLTEQENDV